MWQLGIALFVMIGAVECSKACDTNKCFREVEFEMWELPNEKELKRICPEILKAFVCADETTRLCTGSNLREIAESSSNATAARQAHLLFATGGFFEELCSEETAEHKAYVQSHSCISQYLLSPQPQCYKEGRAAYKAYKELTSNLTEEEYDSPEFQCMYLAYVLVCISYEIQKGCGEIGRFLYDTLMTKTLFWKNILCELEETKEMKAKFFETLVLEGERKDFFQRAFQELLKKK